MHIFECRLQINHICDSDRVILNYVHEKYIGRSGDENPVWCEYWFILIYHKLKSWITKFRDLLSLSLELYVWDVEGKGKLSHSVTYKTTARRRTSCNWLKKGLFPCDNYPQSALQLDSEHSPLFKVMTVLTYVFCWKCIWSSLYYADFIWSVPFPVRWCPIGQCNAYKKSAVPFNPQIPYFIMRMTHTHLPHSDAHSSSVQ